MDGVRRNRFADAVTLAVKAHEGQVRRCTSIPYITHPLAVAALVGEYGGDEDCMIAAVLHDTLEDTDVREADVAMFGERVVRIVTSCTDTTVKPKPAWKPRKVAYVAHLKTATPDAKLVAAADKLHNVGTILSDLTTHGPEVLDRFNAPPEETVWFYGAVLEALSEGWDHPILVPLKGAVHLLSKRVRYFNET